MLCGPIKTAPGEETYMCKICEWNLLFYPKIAMNFQRKESLTMIEYHMQILYSTTFE